MTGACKVGPVTENKQMESGKKVRYSGRAETAKKYYKIFWTNVWCHMTFGNPCSFSTPSPEMAMAESVSQSSVS